MKNLSLRKKLILALVIGLLYATKVLTGLVGTILIVLAGLLILSGKAVFQPLLSLFLSTRQKTKTWSR